MLRRDWGRRKSWGNGPRIAYMAGNSDSSVQQVFVVNEIIKNGEYRF